MPEVLWIHYGLPRTAWYTLDTTAKEGLQAKWQKVRTQSRDRGAVGGDRYHVRGESDFSFVEIWHFPDTAAALDHWVRLTGEAYAEWFSVSNSIGTSMGETE